ncbi:aldo/keto reductase [Streptomyces sp. RKAG293]|uniref:aldo/keto reductase n=1 Tax=Streptomyces sp. RKAG293 TaxID=2893403 RepID=UPI00203455BD|nr:aldo/keto reductase [Streptomyces sp. RKAG293]MCM2420613.1 aldo/keto reductase [Streptomyces sp. RKAG293]
MAGPGPHPAEELALDRSGQLHQQFQALRPYPPHVLIATKFGVIRPGPDHWVPLGRPEYLRAAVEAGLRRLAVGRPELCSLHRIDPAVPLAEQVGALRLLQEEGKIGHIGVSKVDVEQIRTGRPRSRSRPCRTRSTATSRMILRSTTAGRTKSRSSPTGL